MSADSPVLSRTAEYALRALLAIARSGGERPLSAAALAKMTGAPENYLSKTLLALGRAGLVSSSRGRSGGFVLAAAPEQISVARIADVFAERRSTRQCLLGTGLCNAEQPCQAHQRWTHLTRTVRAQLSTTTIADLLATIAGPAITATRPADTAGAS
jgi:Rrf2 family protein